MASHHSLSYMPTIMDSSLEFEAYDEDAFYVELRKRILLLTEVDEDDNNRMINTKSRTSDGFTVEPNSNASAAGFSMVQHSIGHQKQEFTGMNLFRQLNIGKESNGTGVFIPHIVDSRRKPQTGKSNIGRQRRYKQVDK